MAVVTFAVAGVGQLGYAATMHAAKPCLQTPQGTREVHAKVVLLLQL